MDISDILIRLSQIIRCNIPKDSSATIKWPFGDHLYILFHMQWGYVVVTTPNGVLDHEEAIRQNVGGQVLGYFY